MHIEQRSGGMWKVNQYQKSAVFITRDSEESDALIEARALNLGVGRAIMLLMVVLRTHYSHHHLHIGRIF